MSVHKRKRLLVTRQARQDIDNALLYTQQQWGPHQRERYRRKLEAAMKLLLTYPERGRARDDIYTGCRCCPAEHHLVFYYLTDDGVVIDRVLHGSQDASSKF